MAAIEPNVPYHTDLRPGDYKMKKKPRFGWRDDNGKPIHAINDEGTPICGRRRGPDKVPCAQSRLCANGRCGHPSHGGAHLGAPIKHGAYSRFLPTRLSAHYEQIMEDDVLRVIRENLGVLAAMIREKVSEMGDETGAGLWSRARTLFDEYKDAQAKNDERHAERLMEKLGTLFREGNRVQAKEEEISRLMRRVSDLSNTEMKRLEKMRVLMSPQEAIAHHAAIIAILKKHVDPRTLSRVSADLGAMSPDKFRFGTRRDSAAAPGEL